MSQRVILTEGDGDDAFFAELLKVFKLDDKFIIHKRVQDQQEKRDGRPPQAGKDSFARHLRAIKIASEPRDGLEPASVAMVLLVGDGDEDPAKQLREAIGHIRSVAEHYTVPANVRELSSAEPGKIRTAVLMLPWDGEQRCLETICLQLASAKRQQIANCVSEFVKCTGVKPPEWKVQSLSKLAMRCHIAASCPKDPYTGLQWVWRDRSGSPRDLIPIERSNAYVARIVDYLTDLANQPLPAPS